jgi:hypothetical protein
VPIATASSTWRMTRVKCSSPASLIPAPETSALVSLAVGYSTSQATVRKTQHYCYFVKIQQMLITDGFFFSKIFNIFKELNAKIVKKLNYAMLNFRKKITSLGRKFIPTPYRERLD